MVLWEKKTQIYLLAKLNKKEYLMSRHPSYGTSGKTVAKRNVLKRFERLDVMKATGRFQEGKDKKITGLPKTLVSK